MKITENLKINFLWKLEKFIKFFFYQFLNSEDSQSIKMFDLDVTRLVKHGYQHLSILALWVNL